MHNSTGIFPGCPNKVQFETVIMDFAFENPNKDSKLECQIATFPQFSFETLNCQSVYKTI